MGLHGRVDAHRALGQLQEGVVAHAGRRRVAVVVAALAVLAETVRVLQAEVQALRSGGGGVSEERGTGGEGGYDARWRLRTRIRPARYGARRPCAVAKNATVRPLQLFSACVAGAAGTSRRRWW